MRHINYFSCCIVYLLIFFNGKAQTSHSQKEAAFQVNGKSVEGVKYYLLVKDNLYLLPYQHNMICFPDTLSSKSINLVVSYDKHNFFVMNYNCKKAYYLHTYFDNSLFNNGVNKKFGGYSKLKFIFRKRYLIDDGSGYVTITPWINLKKLNIKRTN